MQKSILTYIVSGMIFLSGSPAGAITITNQTPYVVYGKVSYRNCPQDKYSIQKSPHTWSKKRPSSCLVTRIEVDVDPNLSSGIGLPYIPPGGSTKQQHFAVKEIERGNIVVVPN